MDLLKRSLVGKKSQIAEEWQNRANLEGGGYKSFNPLMLCHLFNLDNKDD